MLKIKSLLEKIEEENEIFDNMTNAQKRVVIAQDCIARIKGQQIIPSRAGFLSGMTADILRYGKHCSLKDAINNNEGCSACAKGALFLSYVGRANNMLTHQLAHGNCKMDNSHMKLLEIFTLRQLAMIEYAYEGKQYIHSNLKGDLIHLPDYELKNFYWEYADSNERLIAICENIIKNKGTFKI